MFLWKSGKRDSNSRPQPWQGCALPTELFPQDVKRRRLELPRRNWHYPLKVARLPIPPPLQTHKSLWIKVPRTGLEPARCETHAPETCASTNSATWASKEDDSSLWIIQNVERKTGLEPATPTLARSCSTNWAISAISFARSTSLNAVAKVSLFFKTANFCELFFMKSFFSVNPFYFYNRYNHIHAGFQVCHPTWPMRWQDERHH